MRAHGPAAAVIALGAAAVLLGTAQSRYVPAGSAGAREMLRRAAGFTDAEFALVDRGQPVVKVLGTDRREVAVAGAVRIDGKRDMLVDRMRAVENLKRSDIVLAVGTFSRPPRPEDLDSLPFEEYDLDVRDCRPGNCKVRLSAEDIARFQREVNWKSPRWPAESAAVWRRVLAEHAADYWIRGAAGLARYDNKKEPLSVGEEYNALLRESAFIGEACPEFYVYLQDGEKVHLANAEDLMYWSKEDFSLRPVTRITHQTIYRPVASPGSPVLIATRQIYGTHYMDAALGITFALDAGAGGSQSGFYMISVNRVRTRSLSGFFRGMVRSVVQNRSREALEKILRATKASLEKR